MGIVFGVTLLFLMVEWKREQKFSGPHVHRVIFNHLPQPLRSHIRVLKISPFVGTKAAWLGWVPECFRLWNPHIFVTHEAAHTSLHWEVSRPGFYQQVVDVSSSMWPITEDHRFTCFALIGPLVVISPWCRTCSLIAACWHSPSDLQSGPCKKGGPHLIS